MAISFHDHARWAAVKRRSAWVAVALDREKNQVRVPARIGGWYYYQPLGQEAVQRAVSDPHAVTYPTLQQLQEAYPDAERRPALDVA